MSRLRLSPESGLTLVLIAIVILSLLDSFGLSRVARWIPQVSLATTLVLLVMQLLVESRSTRHRAEPSSAGKASRATAIRRPAAATTAILQIGALAPLFWVLGMAAGAAVFCLVFLRCHADETWRFSLVFSLALGLLMQVIFAGILQISLYPGLIGRFLA